MEKMELKVEVRKETGKGNMRRLREHKKLPGVFYGPHLDQPVLLTVDLAEFKRFKQKGAAVLLTLKADASAEVNGKMAVLKDEEVHPVTGEFMHADFYEVRMDEAIKVSVPVTLTGKAQGVVEGGILEQSLRELEVRCLPGKIPSRIEVDVTLLTVGSSIHISEIELPEGVQATSDTNYTIAAVVAPMAEEAPVVAVPEGEEVPAEVPIAGEEEEKAPEEEGKAEAAPAPEEKKS